MKINLSKFKNYVLPPTETTDWTVNIKEIEDYVNSFDININNTINTKFSQKNLVDLHQVNSILTSNNYNSIKYIETFSNQNLAMLVNKLKNYFIITTQNKGLVNIYFCDYARNIQYFLTTIDLLKSIENKEKAVEVYIEQLNILDLIEKYKIE
jgi:predicted RNA-binding protein with EMAP domain